MNSRTSKLLNRYARANRFSERVLKRVWNKMPASKRAIERVQLKRLLTT